MVEPGAKPRTLHLVACVSLKREQPSPARTLYTSPWFKKARAVVESRGDSWFILSAKHGLLHPDRVVPPYEQTLSVMRIGERRDWAQAVMQQYDVAELDVERIVVFAGKRYREFLMGPLRHRVPEVEVPMLGLGIGQQLAWLGAQV